MTKLGRKTKELVSQGKLKLVPDKSRSPPPHVHLCLECNELITCYNTKPGIDFCGFTFKLVFCSECYQYAKLNYRKFKGLNMGVLENQIKYLMQNKREIPNMMAGLDLKFLTYRNASDIYWNNIYMAEIQAIADKWAMIPDKITKRRELNIGGIKFYLDPSIPKDKLLAADMSGFIKVHNTDTGEEMIVRDKDGEIRKKYDENNQ